MVNENASTAAARAAPRHAVDAAIDYVARSGLRASPCVPLEDLLGLEVEQPNLPGTIDEHPNWRRRLSSRLRTSCSQEPLRWRQRLDRLNA